MESGRTIEKKVLPEYFQAVKSHKKTFELRRDDSDYQVGDILKLREWDGEEYTGKVLFCQISYILRDCPKYGLKPGFCILAIQEAMDPQRLHRTIRELREIANNPWMNIDDRRSADEATRWLRVLVNTMTKTATETMQKGL